MNKEIDPRLMADQAMASVPDIDLVRDITEYYIDMNRDKMITSVIMIVNENINKAASEGLYATSFKLFKNIDPEDIGKIENIYLDAGYKVSVDEKNNLTVSWNYYN